MAFLSRKYYARAAMITDVMARIKKSTLKMIVTQNRVFSMPRLAVKTVPESPPVILPKPAPLLCRIILITRAIDVKIKEPSRKFCICQPPKILADKLYLFFSQTVKQGSQAGKMVQYE
jgi:hypothetical protein